MKKIGIIPNLLKDQQLKMTTAVITCLVTDTFEVYISKAIKDLLKPSIQSLIKVVEENELFKICEGVIAIGGDGTILGVAQEAYKTQTPIIGINMGRLGFLAHIEVENIVEFSQKLKVDDYSIEDRTMLEVKIVEPTGKINIYCALNDITITRAKPSRVTEFELKVNDVFVDFYAADGIVIATPTGSTAYSLSAGGPIVTPLSKVMILTPICPHTIHARAIVTSQDDVVNIKTYNYNTTQLELSVDGQTRSLITPEHYVEIKKSNYTTKLINLDNQPFFEILRKKIVERH